MSGRRRFENDRDYVHVRISISFLFGAIIFLSQQQRHAHGFISQQGLPKVQNESTSPRSRTRLHSHVMSTNGDFVRAVAENQLRGSAQEREDVVVAPPKFDFKSRYSINTRTSFRMSEGQSASASVEYKRAASTPISRLLSLGKSGVGATVLTVLAVLGFWTSSSVIPLTSRNYPIVVNSIVSVPHNRMFSGLGIGGVLAKGVVALESVLTMEKILRFVCEKVIPAGFETIQKMLLMEFWRRVWGATWSLIIKYWRPWNDRPSICKDGNFIGIWSCPQWLKRADELAYGTFERGFKKLVEKSAYKNFFMVFDKAIENAKTFACSVIFLSFGKASGS
eukprot:CAMPEP_0116070232 /NCGR_PEP_ID=MMETSP0322-20121206/12878_1 /TAXON_ID=163516 /ORGANISM="Leptocylindrus danicus var. apora, Strain B651" /LENGTH=335 /DNA_ID=CAMNT_0003557983 /DNA_START=100 /DNA_END=1107 /DNA_ORIENTATION=+